MTTPAKPASDTPRTDAFMLLIDDSEIDLGMVEAKLCEFETEAFRFRIELIEAKSKLARTERELAQALKELGETQCRELAEGLRADATTLERDLLRAQLAAVTQERDNYAAVMDNEASIPKGSHIKVTEMQIADPDHNPDNLFPEQYGAADGWRLLKRSEIREDGPSTTFKEIERYFAFPKPVWEAGYYGASECVTYRTILSVAELAALRAKGAE